MCASSHCRGRILAVSGSALAQHPDLKGTRVGSGQFVTVDKTDHWPSIGEWDFYFYSEQNIAPHQSMRHC